MKVGRENYFYKKPLYGIALYGFLCLDKNAQEQLVFQVYCDSKSRL